MDFSTIETPAQLVEVNNSNKSPLELAKDAMMMEGVSWVENRQMIEWLLECSLEFHRQVATDLNDIKDKDDELAALMWADDAGKLASMKAILDTID